MSANNSKNNQNIFEFISYLENDNIKIWKNFESI